MILALSAPVIVNLVVMKREGIYRVFEYGVMANINSLYKNTLCIKNFFPFSYNIYKGLWGFIYFYIDYITIALLFFSIYKFKKTKYSLSCIIIMSVLLCFITGLLPIMHFPKIFATMQFPWRMMILFCCVLSLFAPISILQIKNRITKQNLAIFLCAILAFFSFFNIPDVKLVDKKWKHNRDFSFNFGSQGEYLPNIKGINLDKKSKQGMDIIKGSADVNITKNLPPYMSFVIKNSKNATIELPRIYYPGYKLYKDNKEIKTKMSKYGFLEFNAKDGNYQLEYIGTKAQRFAKIVRLLSVIVIILFLIKRKLANYSSPK